MRFCYFLILFPLVCSSFWACSSPKPSVKVPADWISNPPSDSPEFLYMLGQADGPNEKISCTKAGKVALLNMYDKIGQKIDQLFVQYHNPIGSPSSSMLNFVEAAADTVFKSSFLQDEHIFLKRRYEEDRRHCIRLVSVPTPKLVRMIDEALSRQDSLYQKFVRSKNYETLMNDFHRVSIRNN